MAEYMSACDCVISKAGPGTIAEAMICGVPIILNGMFHKMLGQPFLSLLYLLTQDAFLARKRATSHMLSKTKLGRTVNHPVL